MFPGVLTDRRLGCQAELQAALTGGQIPGPWLTLSVGREEHCCYLTWGPNWSDKEIQQLLEDSGSRSKWLRPHTKTHRLFFIKFYFTHCPQSCAVWCNFTVGSNISAYKVLSPPSDLELLSPHNGLTQINILSLSFSLKWFPVLVFFSSSALIW
jgi:hypothetical protein